MKKKSLPTEVVEVKEIKKSRPLVARMEFILDAGALFKFLFNGVTIARPTEEVPGASGPDEHPRQIPDSSSGEKS